MWFKDVSSLSAGGHYFQKSINSLVLLRRIHHGHFSD